MSENDAYYDAAAGRWRDDEGWLDERSEDDALADPTEPDAARDADDDEVNAARQRPHREREDVALDPEDDPAFRAARRGHTELSGRVINYGRARTTNPTGFKGQGVRGPRAGKQDGPPDPVRAPIRPTGRQLGGRAPVPGRPSYADAPELVERLLGQERIELLRASFTKRGATTKQERAARAYLAVFLRLLDSTVANRAAAELLGADLRKIGDLRRRDYDEAAVAAATHELVKTYDQSHR
jgi:hypothetical protein